MIEEVSQEQELRAELAKIDTKDIVIVDQQSYDLAASTLLNVIKPWRKRWAEYWAPKKDSAHKTWKLLCNAFNEGDGPAGLAEAAYKKAILAWDQKQERLMEERQRAAQAEAERQEREEREAAAIAAEIEGDMETVEAIQSAPSMVVAAPVEIAYQKVSGLSKRDNWKARVVDLKALAKAVASGKMPVSYILPNQEVLDARAKADKYLLNIPGVQPWNDQSISGRSK